MQHVTIVFDRTLHRDHPRTVLSPFWVRVREPNATRIVEINAASLPEAVRKTVALGLVPQDWTDGGVEMPIPSGLHHMLPN